MIAKILFISNFFITSSPSVNLRPSVFQQRQLVSYFIHIIGIDIPVDHAFFFIRMRYEL